MSIIKCDKINFSYEKERTILEDISFEIEENESVGIIGANGSGKTTLFKLILGLEKPKSGEITVDNLKVKKENFREIRKKIGFLFQDSDNQLFMNSVEDEVSFALNNYGLEEKIINERVDNVLKKLDIEHLKNRMIIKLSGGEKKLVSIASVLAMDPEILLLDEPSNTLDPRYRRIVIDILNSINCTKIIAAHDLSLISKTCSKVLLIHDGKIVKAGKTNDILSNEEELIKYGL